MDQAIDESWVMSNPQEASAMIACLTVERDRAESDNVRLRRALADAGHAGKTVDLLAWIESHLRVTEVMDRAIVDRRCEQGAIDAL